MKILLAISILFYSFAATVPDATHYPLQMKYPETMLYKLDTNEKVIALTFDDGPDDRYTPQVLDVLKKHHIKATFFVVGARVKKYPHIVKRIDHEGHSIGNHSYWHPQFTKTGSANLAWEVKQTEKVIEETIGKKTDLFRAPYGALNEQLVLKLKEIGYRGIGWSIDSEDWRGHSKEKIKQRIINSLHPGAIILMHSSGNVPETVDVLDELIVYLKKEGYQFVTVPDLWKTHYK